MEQLASQANDLPTSSKSAQKRTSGVVVIFTIDSSATPMGEVFEVAISRTARGRFSVTTKKFIIDPERPMHRHLARARLGNIKSPRDLFEALETSEKAVKGGFSWSGVIPKIAELDWVTAAVIATHQEMDIPPLPPIATLERQRSLKGLGDVTIGVEWGDDFREINITFEQWLRILLGERYEEDMPYGYEGEEFTASWRFDVNEEDQLYVGYDDGGTGWDGSFADMDCLEGPIVDEVDLANAALEASAD